MGIKKLGPIGTGHTRNAVFQGGTRVALSSGSYTDDMESPKATKNGKTKSRNDDRRKQTLALKYYIGLFRR